MNRAERRRLERENENRKMPGWVRHAVPEYVKGFNGWAGEMDRLFTDKNKKYAVQIRDVDTEWGKVQHAAIRNAESTEIPWSEKQRIKNEIFGPESLAIEFFPRESELVDVVNMYHIWVMPPEMNFPSGMNLSK